ncbi:uncharacterized protein LOC142355670 isoform X2 [Convolutriloba macropyga]|uniref:uncharacterized protein LOC142355670 isoform X2 n=1 Tax=Convolutriloba macropyga TaxID=536237 RepID=UPI003F521FDF
MSCVKTRPCDSILRALNPCIRGSMMSAISSEVSEATIVPIDKDVELGHSQLGSTRSRHNSNFDTLPFNQSLNNASNEVMDQFYQNQTSYQGCDETEHKFVHIWKGKSPARNDCNSPDTISVDSLENYKSRLSKSNKSQPIKLEPTLVQTSVQSNFSKRRKSKSYTREIEQAISDAMSIIPGSLNAGSTIAEIASNEIAGPSNCEETLGDEDELKTYANQLFFESTYSFVKTNAQIHSIDLDHKFSTEAEKFPKIKDHSYEMLEEYIATNPFDVSLLRSELGDAKVNATEMHQQIETRRRKEAVSFLPNPVNQIEEIISDDVPEIIFSSQRRRSSVRSAETPLINHQDPAGMDVLKSSIARNHFFKKFRLIYISAITLIIIGLLMTIAGAFAVRLTVPEDIRLKFDKHDNFQPFIRHKELGKYEPELSTGNWILLRVVFSFRYFGPFIMGVALFTVAIMLLHNFWVTDRDVKRLNSFLFSDDFQHYPIYFNSVLRKWGYLATKFEGQLRDEKARKISFKTTKLL